MAKYDTAKFYWLQLKEDFFEEDSISWLEEQPNGKEYALFYLKLCLKSLKTNGILIRQVGDILIPYDAKKLAEITRTDFDTVCVAMELLKQIGLIKMLENGEIYISQLENMIGSQSKGAFKKQQQIARRDAKLLEGGKGVENLPPKIDIDIEIEKEIDKEIDIKKKANRFSKPTIQQIQEYCKSRNNNVDANRFYDYYETVGWKVGKNPMKDWKAAVRTWERNNTNQTANNQAEEKPVKKNWFDVV